MSDNQGFWQRFGAWLFGPSTPTPDDKLARLRTLAAMYWLLAFLLGLATVVFLVSDGRGVAVLWAFSSSAAMAAVGFLFGIPKTSQPGAPARIPTTPKFDKEGKPATETVPTPAPTPGEGPPRHFINTNLEDISDWLTKLIIGAALVSWQHVLGAIDRGAAVLAKGIEIRWHDAAGKPIIAPEEAALAAAYGVMVYFGTVGFLFGYNYTRLFLAEVYRLADLQSTDPKLDRIEVAVNGLVADVRELKALSPPPPGQQGGGA